MLPRIAIAGSAICITGFYLYISNLHRSLAKQIEHKHISAEERNKSHTEGHIQSIPIEVIGSPEKFRIIHESDAKSCAITVPSSETEAERLFTLLLRRNMSCFAQMPQCWILRLMAKTPEQKQSFSNTHIQALDFQTGDLFCGFNRVLRRNPTKVEIELLAPQTMGNFSGLLICSLGAQEDRSVLEIQSLQWTDADSSTVLPLERAPAKFLHEMASWWLLETGAKYLEGMSASTTA